MLIKWENNYENIFNLFLLVFKKLFFYNCENLFYSSESWKILSKLPDELYVATKKKEKQKHFDNFKN